MKRLMIWFVAAGMALSAHAQFSPVQVTVQRVSKKKSAQGDFRPDGRVVWVSPNTLAASMSLRITLQNTTTAPMDDVVIRWGISKIRLSGTSHGADVVYGREEKVSLKPKETKVIETEVVEANSEESQLSDRRAGEKIHGHGVQVMLGGRVAWEEYVPATVKAAFASLRPLDAQEQHEKPANPGKPKKN
jgi:hypothetical protein